MLILIIYLYLKFILIEIEYIFKLFETETTLLQTGVTLFLPLILRNEGNSQH